MGASQEEDVPGDLNIDRDMLPRSQVDQSPRGAGLHDPVAGQESDRACRHSQSGTVRGIFHSPRLVLFVLIFLKLFKAWIDLISLADLHLLFTQIWSFNCTLLFLKDFFFNFFL